MNVSCNTTAVTLWITVFFLLSDWSSGMIVPQCVLPCTSQPVIIMRHSGFLIERRALQMSIVVRRGPKILDAFAVTVVVVFVVMYDMPRYIQSNGHNGRTIEKNVYIHPLNWQSSFQTLLFTELFPAYKFSSHIPFAFDIATHSLNVQWNRLSRTLSSSVCLNFFSIVHLHSITTPTKKKKSVNRTQSKTCRALNRNLVYLLNCVKS